MVQRTFFLALLFALFTAPAAMAEEIGSGTPSESGSQAQSSAMSSDNTGEAESAGDSCFTELLLNFFFGS